MGLKHIPAVNRDLDKAINSSRQLSVKLTFMSLDCEARASGKDPGRHREYLLLIIRRFELCDSDNCHTTMEIKYFKYLYQIFINVSKFDLIARNILKQWCGCQPFVRGSQSEDSCLKERELKQLDCDSA